MDILVLVVQLLLAGLVGWGGYLGLLVTFSPEPVRRTPEVQVEAADELAEEKVS